MRRFTSAGSAESTFAEVEVAQTFNVGGTLFMRLDHNFNTKAGIPSGTFNAVRLTKNTGDFKTRLFSFIPAQKVKDINSFVLAHESRIIPLDDDDDDC